MLPNAPEIISAQRTTLDHWNSSIILKYHISFYINFKTSRKSILHEDIWVARLQIRAYKSTMYSQQGRGFFCPPAGLLAHYYSMLVKRDCKAQGLHYSCPLLCYPGSTHTPHAHTHTNNTNKANSNNTIVTVYKNCPTAVVYKRHITEILHEPNRQNPEQSVT